MAGQRRIVLFGADKTPVVVMAIGSFIPDGIMAKTAAIKCAKDSRVSNEYQPGADGEISR